MERFDVVVVGAGPAGSTTAHRLASRGRARAARSTGPRFPRDKPCGGGLTDARRAPAARHARSGRRARGRPVELRLALRARFERRRAGRSSLMTQRRRLDHYLVEQAAAAGAELRDGVEVTDVAAGRERQARRSTASGRGRGRSSAPTASNGDDARSLGLGGDTSYGVAFEGNVAKELVRATATTASP